MRNSPSGSGVYTDLDGAFISIDDETSARKYVVVPLEGFITALIPLPTVDPFATAGVQGSVLIANGLQTRRGKIGRTRAMYVVDTSTGTARRKPTKFQWCVYDPVTGDIAFVGKIVTLPWGPSFPVVPQLKRFANQPIDFGSVPWKAGGAYALVIEVGVKIDPGASGDAVFVIMNETVCEPLSPVPGPEGP
jgi:hypothetical protein